MSDIYYGKLLLINENYPKFFFKNQKNQKITKIKKIKNPKKFEFGAEKNLGTQGK